ncbi:MAG: uracil-DNA glycosylase [Candidatus Aminicenantes bacterium]|nr:MAG: uracil-DNA glycosylase [Candidatus Aminicenantes bacterium]
MEKRAEKLIAGLEERLRFFSQIGIDFVSMSNSKDISFHSLEERVLKCQECELSQGRTNAVPGEGSLKTELMFVGEAPGRDEDIQGRPFVGRAGQLLTKIIGAMEFDRKDVYITNVVKCRPPDNRNPHKEEIETCKNYLLEQIDMIKPRAIVALGKVAADFFIHSSQGMTALRGNFHKFQDVQVMPTFHPSYLIRNEGNKSIKKMVWEDMKKVMAFLGKK